MNIFDGHNDSLTEFQNLNLPPTEFGNNQASLDFDLSKAQEGQFIGGFFAICAPAVPGSFDSNPYNHLTITENGYSMTLPNALDTKYAEEYTNKVIELAHEIEKAVSTQVGIVKSYQDIEKNIAAHKVSMLLHVEGADCIEPDLGNLVEYYNKGIRSLGLVWSRPNAFGNGVPFKFPSSPDTGEGLTEAGKELVRQCNTLGIMVDLAHINYKGFFDVASISTKPLIVSHTAVNKLCPSTRNLLDDQIDEVGKSNGIIGIIFEPINTRADGKENDDTSLQVIVDHILYIANRIGFNCVGFGSDFDGAQTPKEMKDVSKVQNLIEKLRENGVSEENIEKIAWGNWLRVIKESLEV